MVKLFSSLFVAIAQLILGVFILLGHADIRTIGWFYVIANGLTVLVMLLAGVALAGKELDK